MSDLLCKGNDGRCGVLLIGSYYTDNQLFVERNKPSGVRATSTLRLRGRGVSRFRLTLPYGSRTLEKGHDAAKNPPRPTGCPGGFFAARWRALHQEQSPYGQSRSRRKPWRDARFASEVLCEGRQEKHRSDWCRSGRVPNDHLVTADGRPDGAPGSSAGRNRAWRRWWSRS